MWWRTILLTATLAAAASAFDWSEQTALDAYVNFDDGYYSYEILTWYRFSENATTVYMINMTSQKWMDESFTTKSIWWHMMGIAIPDVIQHDIGYLWIEGGSNSESTQPNPPDHEYVRLALEIAVRTGCVGAYIQQVPNQRMVFSNDPDQTSRSEDAIIAWTWHTFITTHQDQPEVILRMPMTKAAKKGLDTIHNVVMDIFGYSINRFIAGGGSKRGWTTWSLGATDQRVIGITPCVMSLLNFNDTLQAHYRNLGGAWTFVFNDYYEVNLTAHFHDDIVVKSPGGLWDYEDMFRYSERLALIPKLMISAAGDEFFLLTDSHTWWENMGGEKWIMMVPNAEHSLVPWYPKVGQSICVFILSLAQQQALPQLSWFRADTATGGLLRFTTDIVPDELNLMMAVTWQNDTRKDFRLAVGYPPYVHPVLWRKQTYQDLGSGNYLYEIEFPSVGFTGFFFEARYYNYFDSDMILTLTSEAHVTPDVYPVPPCYGEECYAYLT